MDSLNPAYLEQILSLIEKDKLTELDAERLLNAAARFRSGVPTGTSQPIQNNT